MVDNNYRNAFKEVYEILKNTDENLVKKIPDSFLQFVENNMNKDFKTNIKYDIDIDKQEILKETEAVLALIYRSYWNEENYVKSNNMNKKIKNIDELFCRKGKINDAVLTKDLIVIKKESFFKKLIKKILKMK